MAGGAAADRERPAGLSLLTALLSVEGLRTAFGTGAGEVAAVDGVDLTLAAGRTLGLVGESGCGKSMLALSVMRLLPDGARIAGGRVALGELDLLALAPAAMRAVRGRRIGMVFQEPMTSLHPMHRVGEQVLEALAAHEPDVDRATLRARALAMLARVRIPAPAARYHAYPHQLSGGLRQRVMLAIALACGPDLLIADEPTTALDVTVQAEILALLRDLQRESGLAILLITHDLGVVAEMADEVAVMYAGRVVERGPVAALFDDPQHPYTLGLLASRPRLAAPRARLPAIEGAVPPPGEVPAGCRFRPRCVFRAAACAGEDPSLRPLGPGHLAACLRAPVELAA